MDRIDLDEFRKVKIKIGKVVLAEKVPDAYKLLRLEVDFGSETRQVVSGIAESYSPEELVGRQFPFVVNLEPRSFKGVESQGMILAIDAKDKVVLIAPVKDVDLGMEVL